MNNTFLQLFLALIVTGVATYFLYYTWKLTHEGFETEENVNAKEGFGGAVRGAGVPDCLRDSANGAQIYEIFSSKSSSTEEGSDDLRELTLLLSKTGCLKKDLMSPSGIVEATRYQAYSTAHDIEPVAETTARCLAKTIPQRDLDIILDKWTRRGKELIRKLCTSFTIADSDLIKVDNKFKSHMDDIRDIANSQCIKGEIKVMKGVRDVDGYTPPELSQLREYKGYY
jgi:hypothetical protein